MHLTDIPFGTVTWDDVQATEHPGASGIAQWRTRHFGAVRVRMVEYSAGYVADHWCAKGHILLCLAGELQTELSDGRCVTLTPGMSYQVADEVEPHRSRSPLGARLFIVD
ncbi:MAG: DHCW motif cupin fold protein [Gemmatimonadaceae bacterium]|nr:DHCW motif cupin fold protein [Gemmatimonadaceae bacterium]